MVSIHKIGTLMQVMREMLIANQLQSLRRFVCSYSKNKETKAFCDIYYAAVTAEVETVQYHCHSLMKWIE